MLAGDRDDGGRFWTGSVLAGADDDDGMVTTIIIVYLEVWRGDAREKECQIRYDGLCMKV